MLRLVDSSCRWQFAMSRSLLTSAAWRCGLTRSFNPGGHIGGAGIALMTLKWTTIALVVGRLLMWPANQSAGAVRLVLCHTRQKAYRAAMTVLTTKDLLQQRPVSLIPHVTALLAVGSCT